MAVPSEREDQVVSDQNHANDRGKYYTQLKNVYAEVCRSPVQPGKLLLKFEGFIFQLYLFRICALSLEDFRVRQGEKSLEVHVFSNSVTFNALFCCTAKFLQKNFPESRLCFCNNIGWDFILGI